MSIQSEIAKMKEYLRESRTAVLDRGGEISATAGLKDLPDAIRSISADTSVVFQTDNSIAYSKTVPENAELKAMLMSVGGMTYKCNNLANINNLKELASGTNGYLTLEGDTISIKTTSAVNSVSGGITLKELCPSLNVGDTCILTANTTSKNKYIYLRGDYKNSWSFGKTKTITQEMLDAPILFYSDDFNSSAVISEFMIALGKTALPYEPYYEGLRNSKVTEIVNRGANLIPFPYSNSEAISSGITFTTLEDGGIKVIGTSTSYATFTLGTKSRFKLEHGKQYKLSVNKTIVSIILCYLDASGVTQYRSSSFVWDSAYELKELYLQVYPNKTVDTIIYPMLNDGDTALPYTPYREPITKPIPEEVQSLEGYGEGISSGYHDYIDFDSKIFVKQVNVLALTGNESFTVGSNYFITTAMNFAKGIESYGKMIGIASEDLPIKFSNSACNNLQFGSGADSIFNYFTDLAEFKSYLAEKYNSGNPVTIVYALAEPTATDISAYLADFNNILDVERGGSLEFVNEYGQAVPSSILYTVKVGT